LIKVKLAAEPPRFDANIRKKGHTALQNYERGKLKKLPPLWREVIPDLLERYDRRCAFIAQYLPHGTATPSVDHLIPKSRDRSKMYEWSNYRLCCLLFNSLKRDLNDVLDPFEISNDWFELEFVAFQIVPGLGVPPKVQAKLTTTLQLLNHADFRSGREVIWHEYLAGNFTATHLGRHAPFIFQEATRQGKLLKQ
jgi:hypothetical protein